jgi:hypothetical protein
MDDVLLAWKVISHVTGTFVDLGGNLVDRYPIDAELVEELQRRR